MPETNVIDPPTPVVTPAADQSAADLSVDDNGQLIAPVDVTMPAPEPSPESAAPPAEEELPEPAFAPTDSSVVSAGMYTGRKPTADLTKQLTAAWTKTLQQNPVSPAYIATHEGISFTARTLAVVQQHVEAELERFEPIETELQNLPLNKVVHFTDATMDHETAYGPLEVPPTFEQLLSELAGDQKIGEPLWDQYSTLMSDPATTLEEVKKLYIALYSESRIAPDKSYVLAAGSVLQDILEGRASK